MRSAETRDRRPSEPRTAPGGPPPSAVDALARHNYGYVALKSDSAPRPASPKPSAPMHLPQKSPREIAKNLNVQVNRLYSPENGHSQEDISAEKHPSSLPIWRDRSHSPMSSDIAARKSILSDFLDSKSDRHRPREFPRERRSPADVPHPAATGDMAAGASQWPQDKRYYRRHSDNWNLHTPRFFDTVRPSGLLSEKVDQGQTSQAVEAARATTPTRRPEPRIA